MADPWMFWPAAEIARVTCCPQPNVEANWPLIANALELRGLWERDVAGGVIATVAIETASTFQPVREAYYLGEPEPAETIRRGMGYYPFYGRGYIQLTHRSNYLAAGAYFGVDLVADPDRALQPALAADILAWFWSTNGVKSKDGSHWYSLRDLCREHDWEWVRRVVQGATAGLDRLIQIVTSLGASTMPTVKYNPNEPPHPQDESYDCSQDSLEWALFSLGRGPDDGWLERTMIAEGVMSADQGLLQASGAGLAAFVGRHYGEFGFYANHEPVITFDGAALEGGHAYPILIGGRAWNHWAGVRGYDEARDLLLLANPADGWQGVGQTMSREQWAALGPFSMVRVLHPDLLEAPPVVVPPVPADTRIPRARVKLVEALAILDEPAPV